MEWQGNDRERQEGLTQHVRPSCVYLNKSARYIEIFPVRCPPSPPRRAAGMQKKAPFRLLHFRPKGSLCHAPAQASFCIFCADIASCILQFVYAPAKKMRDCKGRSRLSARSALQSVSRFEVSTGDPRPFAAGFPIGARAALLAHDFASQSLVCYTFASG